MDVEWQTAKTVDEAIPIILQAAPEYPFKQKSKEQILQDYSNLLSQKNAIQTVEKSTSVQNPQSQNFTYQPKQPTTGCNDNENQNLAKTIKRPRLASGNSKVKLDAKIQKTTRKETSYLKAYAQRYT